MFAALGTLLLTTTGLLLVGILFIYILFLRSPVEPRGIPSVPFYVTLLPLFRDVDQEDIFKKHIRGPLLEHGAVKIFFASQWNVLVERPEFLAQMFKEEDDFQKSGNHKKIPESVLASYLGENIISSHGEVWRSFRGIMQPGLQEGWSADVLFENAERLRENLVSEIREGGGRKTVLAREHAQRLTIANIARVMLGVDFGVCVILVSPEVELFKSSAEAMLTHSSLPDNEKQILSNQPTPEFDQKPDLPAHLHELSLPRHSRLTEP
jgi:unspecific monooxygenase